MAEPDRARAIGAELARIHALLRRDLAAARSDPGLHCLAFCAALRAHHRHEDGAFPGIEAEFPRLAPAIAALRAEHAALAGRIAELERSPDPAALDRLAEDIEAHFAAEEAMLSSVR